MHVRKVLGGAANSTYHVNLKLGATADLWLPVGAAAPGRALSVVATGLIRP